MPSEDSDLLLFSKFLERVFVSTSGGSCATSRTSWGLHTDSTDDGGSGQAGTIRNGTVDGDIGAG
jgi:hypothetical protein